MLASLVNLYTGVDMAKLTMFFVQRNEYQHAVVQAIQIDTQHDYHSGYYQTAKDAIDAALLSAELNVVQWEERVRQDKIYLNSLKELKGE